MFSNFWSCTSNSVIKKRRYQWKDRKREKKAYPNSRIKNSYEIFTKSIPRAIKKMPIPIAQKDP